MIQWQELEQNYYMRTFSRVPVTLVKGEGAWVWDDKGKKYLDFVAGISVNILGHCHPVVVEAVTRQVKTLIHTSNIFYTIPQLQLAGLLVKNSGMDKIFFCNSGAEANEGAVKLARKYGKVHLNGACEVITAEGSFHGRTLAMTAATGQKKFQEPYLPLPAGFINVNYNDITAIKKATGKQTCAVMLEPVEGEGGVIIPSDKYLTEVRQWCSEKGILLILDEIQTGNGRLGSLFAYQQHNIKPDIVTMAKGLAGGVPIGAFMAQESCCVFAPGDHGSTFGGNPLACAAGYATFQYILDHDVPGNARRMGQYFISALKDIKSRYSFITEVRGKGLLLAIEFNGNIAAKIVELCLQNGLLVNDVKPNAIRIMPPLIITKTEIDEAVKILNSVFAHFE